MKYLYKNAIAAGTFDHFHIGHKKLLDNAFSFSEFVYIYVVANEAMYRKKLLALTIESYDKRREGISNYILENGYNKRAKIIPLDTIYGDTLQNDKLDAIYVTNKTYANAEQINRKRLQKGFKTLSIITIPMLASLEGKEISSERIRLGEINRDGISFTEVFKMNKILTLPISLRETLRLPFGTVLQTLKNNKEFKDATCVITIGDIVTKTAIESIGQPAISIIDFKTQRNVIQNDSILNGLKKSALEISNRPGSINTEIVLLFQNALRVYFENRSNTVIVVEGEEDLLALPIMLLAPLGSIVLYGLQGKGAVKIVITEEKKREVQVLLEKFS